MAGIRVVGFNPRNALQRIYVSLVVSWQFRGDLAEMTPAAARREN